MKCKVKKFESLIITLKNDETMEFALLILDIKIVVSMIMIMMRVCASELLSVTRGEGRSVQGFSVILACGLVSGLLS